MTNPKTEPEIALTEGAKLQFAAFRRALGSGMPRLGWKICVNDPGVQRRLGIDGAFASWLDGRVAYADGSTVTLSRGSRLAVEAEIALRVARPLERGSDAEGALAAVDAAAPALELVDYAKASAVLRTIVETGSFHHGSVFGLATTPDRLPPRGAEIPSVSLDGGPPALVRPELLPSHLGSILVVVDHWLRRVGLGLQAGDWILAGSSIAPIFVEHGSTVQADFGPLGRVGASFVRS